MSAGDADVRRRLEAIEKEVEELKSLKNMGKGALWMLLKIGLAVATIVTIVSATWRAWHGPA